MKHTGDNMVSFLKNAATKLETMQVQTALGKADLSDQLEHIKKETSKKIAQARADINAMVANRKENDQHLKAKIQHLELQLTLGKAETSEQLSQQKKEISAAIKDVKKLLTKD